MPPLRSKKDLVLRPIHPNAGIEAAYRKRLVAIIDAMNRSVLYWVRVAYNRNNPEGLAQDESPAAALRAAIRRLTRQWTRNFDEAADDLARYFATAATERSDAALKAILKKAGIAIDFRMTRAANDVVQATVGANVALIKSIPDQYLKNVETLVMRSVQTGRDLGQLSKDLQEQHGVVKRRAAFISQSQNNLATAAMTRARQAELGISEAVWVHSGGGRHARQSHLKAGQDKTRYDVKVGWFDPEVGKNVLPGELPRCRCVSRSVVPGFS